MNKLAAIILSVGLIFSPLANCGVKSKIVKGAVATASVKAFKSHTIAKAKYLTKVQKAKKIPLAQNELKTNTYGKLLSGNKTAKNLEAHHIPSNRFINNHNVKKQDGIAINLHKDRHALTRTYRNGNKSIIANNETPRQALGRDIRDTKKVLEQTNTYSANARKSLQEVIKKNKSTYPNLYNKGKK